MRPENPESGELTSEKEEGGRSRKTAPSARIAFSLSEKRASEALSASGLDRGFWYSGSAWDADGQAAAAS